MSMVIKNIRIITGTGEVIENGFLEFKDGKIKEISSKELTGDVIIDGSGKTMIPGLFDCHVHLGMEVPGRGFPIHAENPTVAGARIMKQCEEFPRYGVTCVRNVGTEDDSDIIVRDFLEEQDFQTIRILASGSPISITGGHGNLSDGFDSAEEVLKETRRKIKKSADVVKIIVTGGMGTKASKPDFVQYLVDDIKLAVEEAEMCGKITAAHCTNLEGAQNAIHAGVRSIEHTQLDEETVQMMVEREKDGKEIFFCPTLISSYSTIHSRELGFQWIGKKVKSGDMEGKMNGVRLCHEGEIRICASADTNSPFVMVGDVLKEIAMYTQCGLSNMEAIQTATKNAAELCMLDKETGTLEVGKCADFVILEANPLDDIENLSRVEMTFRNGRVLYEKNSPEREIV